MRLRLEWPRQWPIVIDDGPRVAEVLPGVTLTVHELVPLPADLRAWGDRIVFGDLPVESVRVALVKDTETETGWPLTLFGSDAIDRATGAIVERRLHAIYRFERWGATACLQGADTARFDSVVKEVTAVLLRGAPDWSAGEIVHLREVWTGLELVPAEEPSGAAASEPSSPPPPPSFSSDF